jgi:hypothetical protein
VHQGAPVADEVAPALRHFQIIHRLDRVGLLRGSSARPSGSRGEMDRAPTRSTVGLTTRPWKRRTRPRRDATARTPSPRRAAGVAARQGPSRPWRRRSRPPRRHTRTAGSRPRQAAGASTWSSCRIRTTGTTASPPSPRSNRRRRPLAGAPGRPSPPPTVATPDPHDHRRDIDRPPPRHRGERPIACAGRFAAQAGQGEGKGPQPRGAHGWIRSSRPLGVNQPLCGSNERCLPAYLAIGTTGANSFTSRRSEAEPR